MSIFSAASAQIVSNQIQADRTTARQRSPRHTAAEVPNGRGEDELDLQVQNTQTVDAVRTLKGSIDEETADEKPKQQPKQAKKDEKDGDAPPRPRLDLQG